MVSPALRGWREQVQLLSPTVAGCGGKPSTQDRQGTGTEQHLGKMLMAKGCSWGSTVLPRKRVE